jgi:large subunit ribosomal protein L21
MADFAIVRTGSKQYLVEANQVLDIEKLDSVEDGKDVELTDVLFVKNGDSVKIGQPLVNGARIVCENLGLVKAPKVTSFMYRRRKDSKRIRGHRQNYLRLRVKEIKI